MIVLYHPSFPMGCVASSLMYYSYTSLLAPNPWGMLFDLVV